MKTFLIIFLLILICACKKNEVSPDRKYTNRELLFGFDFKNDQVKSIDIVDSADLVLNGKYRSIDIVDPVEFIRTGRFKPTTLSDKSKLQFLDDLDNLNDFGIFFCHAENVVFLNMRHDTLYLKVCGDLISNRISGRYLKSPSERFFAKYLK